MINNTNKILKLYPQIIVMSLAVLFYTIPVNADVTPSLSGNSEPNLTVTCTGANACNAGGSTTPKTGNIGSPLNTSVMDHLAASLGFSYNALAPLNVQFWTVSSGQNVTAQAKFAGNSETIGWVNGTTTSINAGNFQSLFSISGSGYVVGGSSTAIVPVPITNQFQFVLNSPSGSGNYFSSQIAANSDLYQHIVAYALTPTIGSSIPVGSFMLAFEDLPFGTADLDYNDAVILVSGVTPVGLGVPEPSTYLILGSALGLILLRRKSLRNA